MVRFKNRCQIYTGPDGETELAVKIHKDDLVHALHKLGYIDDVLSSMGAPCCDWCATQEEYLYYFPELGSKVMCYKCAKQHMENVKWYQEDMHTIYNMFIVWIKSYDINWTDEDYDIIDEYFKSHSNRNIHIRDYL